MEEEYYVDKLKNLVEKELEQFANTELDKEDLDTLGKLVDIDKDLENICYWNFKKEAMTMRYGNYGRYSDGGYGNYGNYGNYNRYGNDRYGRERYGRPRNEADEILNNMSETYSAYLESNSAYNRGNYNAGQDSMKALEDTMRLFTEFAEKMIREVESPEAKQIIKKHLHKISQMGDM